jgi:hypothetical protein
MYSVLLDNALLKHDYVDFYVGKENGLSPKQISSVVGSCLNLLDQSQLIDFKSIVEFTKHLLHINDYNNLSLLLDLAYNKKYYDFCDLFYSPLYNKNLSPSLIHSDSSIPINLLDNMVFVVNNKALFINSIREKGYNVSEGPQSLRGHINSMSSFLSYLDTDYRNSLYNHYKYHCINRTLLDFAKDYPLKKEHFCFRNIHHKLGNIR